MWTKMWDVVKVRSGEEERYLKKGWEPFGVVTHHDSYKFLDTSSGQRETKLTSMDFIFLRKWME